MGRPLILNDQSSDPLPAELAPFLVDARERLAAATDGLQHQEAIQHLETTLAEAEAEASRLGLQLGPSLPVPAMVPGEEQPVVVIRRMIDPSEV